MLGIENSLLYQEMVRRFSEVPAPPGRPLAEFDRLCDVLREHGKYIVRAFPEYTPHDPSLHLDHLFPLADRLLGRDSYERLNATELLVLAFSLYAHDWGMAVSEIEQSKLTGNHHGREEFCLLPDEPESCREYLESARSAGTSNEQAWTNYLRRTHGLRSGARLRQALSPLSAPFAEAVAKAAEGHTLEVEEIRDTSSFPVAYPLFGQVINLAAIANYVRIVDLLDIGEDRTPFALWKFVQPQHPVSSMEWKKHRALSPVSIRSLGNVRQVIVGGTTDDVRVYAALADLRSWVDMEFQNSVTNLRNLGRPYTLDFDTRIEWSVRAQGFEPELARFNIERSSILGLLSSELYESQPLAFVRELLQNSVDAIDARQALLSRIGLSVGGKISVSVTSDAEGTRISWKDNGIGMDAHTIRSYFSVIGKSWYRSDEYARIGVAPEPISKFGIGFLSCFSVADLVVIRTRKDTNVSEDGTGYLIEIPDRNAYFRITKQHAVSIGSEIELLIREPRNETFSVESFTRHLERFGAYVAHEIDLTVNGITKSIPSLDRLDSVDADTFSFESTPAIVARSVAPASDDFLSKSTRKILFSFGSKSKEYRGHYSALIPLEIESIQKTGNWEWMLSGRNIDLQGYVHNASDDIFVKGILSGPVHLRRRSRHTENHTNSGAVLHGDWIGPKVSLNLSRPSLMHFNLSRTSARLAAGGWHDDMWAEIGTTVREMLFERKLETPIDRAYAIGVASQFAGIPLPHLTHIVPATHWPALALVSGEGLKIANLSDCFSPEEAFEAPLEFQYALSNREDLHDLPAKKNWLAGWTGPPVLITRRPSGTRAPYWTHAVIPLTSERLREAGFAPTELLPIRIDSDDFPLFCKAWKRRTNTDDQTIDDFLKRSDGIVTNPLLLRRALGEYAPEIFPFPENMSDVAAIGSAYWNAKHPKVLAIIRTLLRLAASANSGELSQQGREVFENLCSSRYNDFFVPSCRARAINALGMQAELLRVATAEGLGECPPLTEQDALPGSVGKYHNPYHYDLRRVDKQRGKRP